MPRLPVSGAEKEFRPPDGADDIVLHECAGNVVQVGILLLDRLAGPGSAALSVTDFEILLLELRATRFGQDIAVAFACPRCAAVAELAFRVADLVAAVRPRAVPGVAACARRPGWYVLDGAGFRLPSAGDQAAVLDRPAAVRRLAAICLDDAARARPHRPLVERAMAAMAPPVSRDVMGACPSCGAAVPLSLHVTRIVMAELRRAAVLVHDELDLIAGAYHWSEATILALPQARRREYAARIRRGRAQAA